MSRSFNPRAPCGARRRIAYELMPYWMFQSTRPVRGATKGKAPAGGTQGVSIHAPRAGRDCGSYQILPQDLCFNPRAPCGARHMVPDQDLSIGLFQSTRPVRGATYLIRRSCCCVPVSIHAPRAGRDDW